MAKELYGEGRVMSTPPYSSKFNDQIIRAVQETQQATLVAHRHSLHPSRRWVWVARHQDRENGGDVLRRRKCSMEALDYRARFPNRETPWLKAPGKV